ncbi:unnamed protein product [Paramecium sonneborni]|uniref:Uncharacterized protein n=1 Tax=Paramecium sonneborni TaxID=65129 RepID=A0A8S1QWY3_9CILI|nr:unnamed protein product [Paramecium sonneborni]
MKPLLIKMSKQKYSRQSKYYQKREDITIAYRIKTILHCDKILVVDQGKTKEFGQTKDLL